MFKLQEQLSVILVKALFISFIALFSTDFGILLYTHSTGFPTSNWGVVGRWFVMLAHGKFYTLSIANEPAVPYEYFIGLFSHGLIAYIFSISYVVMTSNIRILSHFYVGPFFGLVLSTFPLFIQLPSMGNGFLGMNSSNHFLLLAKVMVAHFSLGVGLAAGYLLLIFLIRNAKNSQ